MTQSMTSTEFLAFQQAGPEKNPGRVMQGKRAQSGGKAFEAQIDRANAEYERLGIARIEKLPVATSPMPRTWIDQSHQKQSGICRILSQRAPFDYYGTIGELGARPLANRGRAIAMECKATTPLKSLNIGDKGKIKPHQLHACATSWLRFGTIAVIVWLNGDQRGVLTPDRIVDADQRYRIGSRKSIPWGQFVPYPREPIDSSAPIEHWLKPVGAFINLNLR